MAESSNDIHQHVSTGESTTAKSRRVHRTVSRLVCLVLAIAGLLAFTGLRAPAAFAQGSSDGCPLEATISSLQTCVEHAADMGFIDNQGVTQSLLTNLAAAQAAQDRGQNLVAEHLLQAFIYEVQAQAGKHIDADHAEHMIVHAQAVIESLEGQLP